jgi:asparagine synthase (glutamine-hydrolysing)
MVAAFDEPFGNSSAIPTYFCAKLAADHGVRVLLGGDGGDELFAGNERYLTDKIFAVYDDVPVTLRAGLIEPALRVLPSAGVFGRAARYVRRAKMPGVERMMSFQFLQTHAASDVFEPDFVRALDGYSVLEIPTRHYGSARAGNHLDRLLYVDTKITLADNDLPKVTMMCEAMGVRSRYPFLDRSVAEFSGTLPLRLKIKGLNKRYLFKRAFRDLLPPEIIRKKKHGFGIPVANWFKSDRRLRELSRDALLSRRSLERGYVRRAFLAELFQRHEQDDSSYYGDTLWVCLAIELWHRQVVDEKATHASSV